jgi:hypothetical protein
MDGKALLDFGFSGAFLGNGSWNSGERKEESGKVPQANIVKIHFTAVCKICCPASGAGNYGEFSVKVLGF